MKNGYENSLLTAIPMWQQVAFILIITIGIEYTFIIYILRA